MRSLSKDELDLLINYRNENSISIYLPTHRGGRAAEIKQDQIKLKNLIRTAREQLLANKLRTADVDELILPINRLLEDDSFWEEQSEGLAIFCATGLLQTYRLPIDLNSTELALVSHRLHVKPLLALFTNDGKYFILAISQNQVRLLEGTHYHISELSLPAAMPKNLATVLKYEEREQQPHFTSGRPERGSERTNRGFDAVFHSAEVDEKNELLRYFQQVDRGLHEVLKEERAPLVLAGVDYLLSIYRLANTYRYLLEESITMNPDEQRPDELRELAWPIVSTYFLKDQQQAVDRYHELLAKKRATNDVNEAVRAAYQGRVEKLFVAINRQIWGFYNPDQDKAIIHNEAQPGDIDLLDFAAAETVSKGGTVYALKSENIPDQLPLAAIFRYMAIGAMGGGTKSK
ncbi:MAG: hypothetical protein AB1489_35865 [Acidobacteriota bacterium]